jgi:CelD/BcsL family acetyltransferase involved in cellulose biosynthesis
MFSAQETLKLDTQERFAYDSTGHLDVAGGRSIEIFDAPQHVRSEWQMLEAEGSVPFTGYAWAEAWFDTVASAQNQQPVIVLGRAPDGSPAYILPFVLEKRGPFSVLLWPGGTHCAYQCGLFSRACRAHITKHGTDAFWKEVFAKLPRADAIAGYGLPGLDGEHDNPLAALPAINASCVSYRFELDDRWPALYQAKCSSRLRSDDRRCERRLVEMGDVRFVVGETEAERLRLIDTLLEQKSVQLRESGAPDFTSGDGVRDFYRRLVTSPHWAADSQVFLSALDVDGAAAAVNLGIIKDGTFHGLVLSMTDGPAVKFAPGRQLLKRTIEHFCDQGLRTFDLGAGEESNKVRWADRSVSRQDVLVPLTLRGRVFVQGMRTFFAAKTAIKHSPTLWRVFSRFRKYLGC